MKKILLLFGLILLVNGCNFLIWEPDTVAYHIPSGAHSPIEPFFERMQVAPKGFRLTATFDSTCIYDIGADHQNSWNKLWGYGYLGSANQGIEAAHRVDSFRFGWRWNQTTQRIEISAYIYDQGTKLPDRFLTAVNINEPVSLWLRVDYQRHLYYTPWGEIPFSHNKTIAYRLNPFFGGQLPAPHLVRVKIRME
jgi:hypothetical protein